MPLLDPRDAIQFEEGSNSSSTTINDITFNLTTLRHFGYTLYSNKTISNSSSECYLIFDEFKPSILDNGTWVNGTTCYIPYYGIQTRGILSIVFGSLFGITIVFTLINLRKHGKLYLREDKRFRVVGRRWQWYWMLFVSTCGLISALTGVDIDRNYLQDLAIILQSFFFMLMVPGALAMVWEGTRHWGSWQERQILDVDTLALPQRGRRAKIEFWLPLVFYLFAVLNFFTVIPQSWTALKQQNSDWQKEHIARPAATSDREKAGSMLAVSSWLVICYSLKHSLKHYAQGSVSKLPPKLLMNIALLGVRLGYGVASAWIWDLSVFQYGVHTAWPFGLGFAPILLILVVFNIAGLTEDNEDAVLIQQRISRGKLHNAELRITNKPNWWQKNLKDKYASDDQRLENMVNEVDSKSRRRKERDIELGPIPVVNHSHPEDPFSDEALPPSESSNTSGVKSRTKERMQSGTSSRTDMTGTTVTRDGGPPSRTIRSMLDV